MARISLGLDRWWIGNHHLSILRLYCQDHQGDRDVRMHMKLFTLPLDTERAYRLNEAKALDMGAFDRNQMMASLLGQELQRAYKT